MKLYYVPMTRSNRPRWMLEELEAPYELVRLDPNKGDNKTPEYLAINPTGKVPSLVDGTSRCSNRRRSSPIWATSSEREDSLLPSARPTAPRITSGSSSA